MIKKVFGNFIEILKLVIIAMIITGIVSFSTVGFLSMFTPLGENERIIKNTIAAVCFITVFGFILYHRYHHNRRLSAKCCCQPGPEGESH